MIFAGIANIDDLLTRKDSEEITLEMLDFFDKRTEKHIKLVQKYCQKIYEYDKDRFEGLLERSEDHDQSKYDDLELDPYIYITWEYHCKDLGKACNYSKEIRNKMNEATNHHVLTNRHHPEYHSKSTDENTINREDRDAIPDKTVDATAMSDLDIGEMCADWCAMSEERGNTPTAWADKNINKRWKFTPDQVKLIYELLDSIWV